MKESLEILVLALVMAVSLSSFAAFAGFHIVYLPYGVPCEPLWALLAWSIGLGATGLGSGSLSVKLIRKYG